MSERLLYGNEMQLSGFCSDNLSLSRGVRDKASLLEGLIREFHDKDINIISKFFELDIRTGQTTRFYNYCKDIEHGKYHMLSICSQQGWGKNKVIGVVVYTELNGVIFIRDIFWEGNNYKACGSLLNLLDENIAENNLTVNKHIVFTYPKTGFHNGIFQKMSFKMITDQKKKERIIDIAYEHIVKIMSNIGVDIDITPDPKNLSDIYTQISANLNFYSLYRKV